MCRHRSAVVLFSLLIPAVWLPAQTDESAATKPTTATKVAPVKDVDPLALDVLKAVDQPIQQAQTLSFKALITEEEVATNGQIVTFFHTVDVTVQRPDKMHLVFRGRGQRVDYYVESGKATKYAPDAKLYLTRPAKATIDENLADIRARGIDMPIGPFLRSDLYEMAAKALVTGYVIGNVSMFDQDVTQAAFSSADSDWQLWAVGGAAPRILRAEIVNKSLEGKPRTTIQFLDWNLSPTIAADEFIFTKPNDAHEIGDLPTTGGK
jgi:hypothetical protein